MILRDSLAPPAFAQAVTGRHGMVVTADSLASAAGLEVLRTGGNAIDAAVAAGFALAVTYPEAGNIGGGGFMVIRKANGSSTVIDFREMAPHAARRDMYLDTTGAPIKEKSLLGPLAAGVPGTVDGLLYALDAYGSKGRDEVLAPAAHLAQQGFTVDTRLAASLQEEWRDLSLFPSSVKVFSRRGRPYQAGDTLRQPDLAETLRAIMANGRDGFYRGPVAEKIVAEMKRNGGIISLEDLEGYHAVERAPLRGTYRGYEIVTVPPPSSGGIVLLQILNFLEQSDPRSLGWNSSKALHVFASACQLAFADRSAYLGDPGFVSMPIQQLISKEYARERWAMWDSLHATHSTLVNPGLMWKESTETTHYCAADRWGNVVSVTYTLNGSYGCKTVVEGGGFVLNNEMDDFSVKVNAPNMFGLITGELNSIEPGKRMLSSMSPTIVLKNGMPLLAAGARGGGRIPTTTAQIISNVIDFGMEVTKAVAVPRVHHQWFPDSLLYERGGFAPEVLRELGSMGYSLRELSVTARAQALMVDPEGSVLIGGPDPREQGVPLGF